MLTINELRENAIKEDKNPEFYLYQKLEKIIDECTKIEKDLEQEEEKIKELVENTYCIDYKVQYYIELLKINYARYLIIDLKDKFQEILKGEKENE